MMIENLTLEARCHEVELAQELVLIQGYWQVTLPQAEQMYFDNRQACLADPFDSQAWFMYEACSQATGLPIN